MGAATSLVELILKKWGDDIDGFIAGRDIVFPRAFPKGATLNRPSSLKAA